MKCNALKRGMYTYPFALMDINEWNFLPWISICVFVWMCVSYATPNTNLPYHNKRATIVKARTYYSRVRGFQTIQPEPIARPLPVQEFRTFHYRYVYRFGCKCICINTHSCVTCVRVLVLYWVRRKASIPCLLIWETVKRMWLLRDINFGIVSPVRHLDNIAGSFACFMMCVYATNAMLNTVICKYLLFYVALTDCWNKYERRRTV